MKTRGLRVVRASVTKQSDLVGKSASEVNFRNKYSAAIVTLQKHGKNVPLNDVVFEAGDILVLQTSDDSPLLIPPPVDFYKSAKQGAHNRQSTISKSTAVDRAVNKEVSSEDSLEVMVSIIQLREYTVMYDEYSHSIYL